MNGLDVDKLDWRSNRYRRRVILGAGEKGVTEFLGKKYGAMGVRHYALIIANGACWLCVQFDTIEVS